MKRYTSDELKAMRERGESKTDLARVRAKTKEDLELDIAMDSDWKDVPKDWHKDAIPVIPEK